MGANLAMRDGASLAQALAAHAAVDDAVTAYEKILIPCSVEAAEEAAEGTAPSPPTAPSRPSPT
ncbi:hypothetical protein ACIGN6_17135 [Streptomyces sp. NPDC053792]|uniref:hypothetical protein n=1 Tax=Streptomyces sp. NPDC053792 TaxID=3365716 RepID=UPI0037CFF4CF